MKELVRGKWFRISYALI